MTEHGGSAMEFSLLPKLVLDSKSATGMRLAKRLGLLPASKASPTAIAATPRLPPVPGHAPVEMQNCYARPHAGRKSRSPSPRCPTRCSPTPPRHSALGHHTGSEAADDCKGPSDIVWEASLDAWESSSLKAPVRKPGPRRERSVAKKQIGQWFDGSARTTAGSAATSYGGMEALCRESFLIALDEQAKTESQLAKHRREEGRNAAKMSRQRAKAWKERSRAKEQKILAESKRKLKEKEELLTAMEQRVSPNCDTGSAEIAEAAGPPSPGKGKNRRRSGEGGERIGRQASESGDGSGSPSTGKIGRVARLMMKAEMQDQVDVRKNKNKARSYKEARLLSLRIRYASLPQEEQDTIELAFYRHVEEDILTVDGAIRAITDLGIRGIEPAERRELSGICNQKCGRDDVDDPCEFAMEVVQACRRAVVKSRLHTFKEYLEMCNRTWEGRFIQDQFEAAVKMILPWELLDHADDCQRTVELQYEVQQEVLQYIENEGNMANLIEKLVRLSEAKLRYDVEHARGIQAKYRLSEEQTAQHLSQIVALERFFLKVDFDGSGFLEKNEVVQLLHDFKVTPGTTSERRQVMSLLASITQVDFRRFLDLVVKIREMTKRSRPDVTREDFDRCIEIEGETPDESQISGESLRQLLSDSGVLPKPSSTDEVADGTSPSASPRIQVARQVKKAAVARHNDVLSRLLVHQDEQGVELFTYNNVLHLCGLIFEFGKYQKVLEEEQAIRACQFPPHRLKEFRKAFQMLDKDATGFLSKAEVRWAVDSLGISFEPEFLFDAAFRQLDDDNSGELDFRELVQFMKMVRDKEGVFRSDTMKVTTLEDLTHVDLVILLHMFGHEPHELDAMPKPTLLFKAAELLNIGKQVQLGPLLGVTNLGELNKHAQDIAGNRAEETQQPRAQES